MPEKNLPEELDLSSLTQRAMPGDTTLGVAKGHFNNGEIAAALRRASRNGKVRLRFLRSDREEELPDSTTMEEFRSLVDQGLARISLDDGSGGVLESV